MEAQADPLMAITKAAGWTNPSQTANNFCFRRCVNNFKHEPTMELGEKTCMSRCAKKFYEAYDLTVSKRIELTELIKEDKYEATARLIGVPPQSQ
ncbi:hypothetical protein DIPPA_07609 [Diplonema papillatum]|nr:hypothetical protein DIPPA_07609 [Diplonema papillatum]